MGPSFYKHVENSATRYGDREFAYDGTRRITFSQLLRNGRKVASSLYAEGVSRGDVVIACIPNWVDFIEVYAGASACGAVFAALPPDTKGSRLAEVVDLINPRAVFVVEDYQVDALVDKGYDGCLVSVRFENDRCLAYDHFLCANANIVSDEDDDCICAEKIPDLDFEPVRQMDISTMIFTSGSTGTPKGVMSTAFAHEYVSLQVARSLNPTADDVFYIAVPLCHIFGLCNGLMIPLMHGARMVLSERYSSKRSVELILDEGCTIQFGVPTMFIRQLRVSEDLGVSMPLRAGVLGGAVTPQGFVEEFEKKTGCRLLPSYGMTETTGGVTLTYYNASAQKRYEAEGCAIEGAQIAIFDERGERQASGVIGEIAVKTPGIMGGYYKGGQMFSEPSLADSWFRTGDLGALDEDGYLHVTGRIKDVIIRGGSNIYPSEVESIYQLLPEVSDACLLGYESGDLGERTCLFVALASDRDVVTEDFLLEHARAHLEKHKVPDRIEILSAMPRLQSSKVDKRALAEMLQL